MMGAQIAPQWLISSFVRSVSALGATAPKEEIERTGMALLERWCSPQRHHHTLSHLVAVLQAVDELAQETHNPELLRVAAWYHGAVFDPTVATDFKRAAGEHKAASAQLALEQLLALGVPEALAARVHDLILNLRRHDADPSDVDALALNDADLASLAVEPQKYKEYRRRVRHEYSHVEDLPFLSAREAIITRLLSRRRIFMSPLAVQWEEPARQNLAAELARVRAELARLGAVPSQPEAPAPALPQASTGPDTTEPWLRPATVDRSAAARFAPKEAPASREPRPVAGPPASNGPVSPGRPGGVPQMAPAKGRTPASAGTPDDDEAECIGVPYEEQQRRPKGEDRAATSGIERAPETVRRIPRRGVARPDDAAPSSTAPSGASPARPGRRPSTPGAEGRHSTGGLFNPL